MKYKYLTWLLAASVFCPTGAFAQPGPPAPPASASSSPMPVVPSDSKATPNVGTPQNCPSIDDVFVEDVFHMVDGVRKTNGDPPHIKLGDAISVKLKNWDHLLARSKCAIPRKKIVLFLGGRQLKEIQQFPSSFPAIDELHFQLKRKEADREVWAVLLGKPSLDQKELAVSVGLEDDHPVATNAKIELIVLPKIEFWSWAVFLVLAFGFFLKLARESDVLRDTGNAPTGGGEKTYSLARVQMAFWFFIVLASYVLIGLVTGDYSTSITASVIGLIGISGGTYVLSAVIEKPESQTTLATTSTIPPAGAAGVTTVVTSTTTTPATVTAETAHKNWYVDLLSDKGSTGVSFHRFQMATWTVVLGVVFVQGVYQALAMPEFSATLLSLMGISAGTYLSIKSK